MAKVITEFQERRKYRSKAFLWVVPGIPSGGNHCQRYHLGDRDVSWGMGNRTSGDNGPGKKRNNSNHNSQQSASDKIIRTLYLSIHHHFRYILALLGLRHIPGPQ